jgi:molecular chaperone GrpE
MIGDPEQRDNEASEETENQSTMQNDDKSPLDPAEMEEFTDESNLFDVEQAFAEASGDPIEAMAALTEERDELKDKLLRALAENENIRKRSERDRRDAEVYGGTKLARDILSVYDNLNRALDAVDDSFRKEAAALIEGIEITQKDLVAIFSKHQITKIAPDSGEKFDARFHESMFEAPMPGTNRGEVIQVMTEGFMIGERVLRPAQVGISAGGPAVSPEPSEE